MNNAQEADGPPISDPTAERKSSDQKTPRFGQRPWHPVAGKTLFEIMIVAVGVLLALAVDEWRERSGQQQLAHEARTALRSEILSNREAILSRLRRTSQLHVQTAAHPDRVAQYVFDRRNRQLLLNDAAWTMTVETGAIRWLTPAERGTIADVYAGHERMREISSEELHRWTELAAFPSTESSGEMQVSRDRAIRIWQAYSQRVQLALCINAARHESALGAKVPREELIEFCARRPPDEDPALMYRNWRRLGWASSVPPALLIEGSAE